MHKQHLQAAIVTTKALFYKLSTCAGYLGAVGSLDIIYESGTSVMVSWTAPFTFNITGVNTSINYYVEVNSTQPSQYNTYTDSTALTIPNTNPWCSNYTVTVTPKNPAGWGTSTSASWNLNATSMFGS